MHIATTLAQGASIQTVSIALRNDCANTDVSGNIIDKHRMDKETAIKVILEKIKSENDGKHIDFVIPGYAAKKLVAYERALLQRTVSAADIASPFPRAVYAGTEIGMPNVR